MQQRGLSISSSATASSLMSGSTELDPSASSYQAPDMAGNSTLAPPDPALLTVQHAYASHRPSLSIDGATLRPRSGSFASSADTMVRSRANSVDPGYVDVDASSKVDYDDVSL